MRSKVIWAGHMVRMDADKLVKRVEERGRKHTRRSGEDERWRGGGKYGKNQQKELLDNILPDPNPCTAGNKEEKHR